MQMFFDAADSKSCFQKRSTREDISQYSNQKIIYNVLGSSPWSGIKLLTILEFRICFSLIISSISG